MCGTSSTKTNWHRWDQEKPSEPGDYLWCAAWGCGCLRQVGVIWVIDYVWSDTEPPLLEYEASGRKLYVWTEGSGLVQPKGRGNDLDIDLWMPFHIPPDWDIEPRQMPSVIVCRPAEYEEFARLLSEALTPSNDTLRKIAKTKPPDPSWLEGEEERPW